MRHLFDQYSQPENRITHALVSGLAQDSDLLKAFILWVTKKRFPRGAKINIVEQSIPGDIEIKEDDAEEQGLPDAWIYTDDGWSLLIESKIASPVDSKQLLRHIRTAKRRGFNDCALLVLATKEKIKKLPDGMLGIAWNQVYEWLCCQSHSAWARQILTYMEIAEAKMAQAEYLKEGTLTRFSGIPFSRDCPFNYLEAKRVLGLLLGELKGKKSIQALGVDPDSPGRGAIKAFKGWSVWDFMRLRASNGISHFTKYPHLTVSIQADKALALVTLPNAVMRSIRERVFGQGHEAFEKLIYAIAQSMKGLLKLDPSIQPYAKIVQRHYPSQSSPPVEDAVLRYDLRTVINNDRRQAQKYQPQWLETTYTIMTQKKSNIQFEVGVDIPYRESKVINTPRALMLFERSFIALKPFIDIIES